MVAWEAGSSLWNSKASCGCSTPTGATSSSWRGISRPVWSDSPPAPSQRARPAVDGRHAQILRDVTGSPGAWSNATLAEPRPGSSVFLCMLRALRPCRLNAWRRAGAVRRQPASRRRRQSCQSLMEAACPPGGHRTASARAAGRRSAAAATAIWRWLQVLLCHDWPLAPLRAWSRPTPDLASRCQAGARSARPKPLESAAAPSAGKSIPAFHFSISNANMESRDATLAGPFRGRARARGAAMGLSWFPSRCRHGGCAVSLPAVGEGRLCATQVIASEPLPRTGLSLGPGRGRCGPSWCACWTRARGDPSLSLPPISSVANGV